MSDASACAPIEIVLGRLDAVRSAGKRRWIARCPAHEDRTPSLSIRETEDRSVLIHCFAGCAPGEITDAIGVSLSSLFADRPQKDRIRGDGGRFIDYQEILAARQDAAHEALIVWLAAEDLSAGREVNVDRVAVAAGRLWRARDVLMRS